MEAAGESSQFLDHFWLEKIILQVPNSKWSLVGGSSGELNYSWAKRSKNYLIFQSVMNERRKRG